MAASCIDEELDRIDAGRQLALSLPHGQEKSIVLAGLAVREAVCWEDQFERATSRPQWRAALVAREFALRRASYWRAQAANCASNGCERGATA